MATARTREEPDVLLPCGHVVNMLGCLRVLGATLGQLEQWCDKCGDWKKFNPNNIKKRKGKKADPGKDVLF